jgi:hypothetical protein
MNTKRYILTSLIVWLVYDLLNFILHGMILSGAYQEHASIFRPNMQNMMWIIYLANLFFAFAFVFIFTKGYENKGLAEGFRYGIYISWLTWLPASLIEYAMYPYPFSLIVYMFIGGVITFILLGVLTAALYKPATS